MMAEVEKFRYDLAQQQREYFLKRQDKALLSASRRNVELKNELQKLREEFANERREYLRLKKDTFRTKRGRLALLFGPRQRSAQAQATPALTLDERIPKLSVNTDDR